jgi:hypothetical protein
MQWKRLLTVGGLVFAGAAIFLGALIFRSWRGSRVTTTAARLWKLQRPLQDYALAHGRYPQVRTAEELRAALEPFTEQHDRPLDVEDGWGRPFRFTINPQNYLIWSAGADDKRDARWVRVNQATTTVWPSWHEQRNDDQVMYNGFFLQSPVGWASNDLDSVTVLDEKRDRANTGAVYMLVPGHEVEIRRADSVIAGDHFLYELPPGQYVCRLTRDEGRSIDVPLTVERERVIGVRPPVKRHENWTKP